jgi:hypothetical protein
MRTKTIEWVQTTPLHQLQQKWHLFAGVDRTCQGTKQHLWLEDPIHYTQNVTLVQEALTIFP